MFIDSQARSGSMMRRRLLREEREKKSKNASKKGKRKRDDLHEESDDESVGHLISKHCKGPKKFGVMKSYEQAEEREAKKTRLNQTMMKVLMGRRA
ncbi:hypothetical protein ACHAW5_002849 [Stephanodiscus triporus]|uniref:Uncharacterized protein n=1 Tax=Stephanodiscus triporus TaxID=2934178 RepID=A0ABD3PZJ4_9STRA